MQAQTRQGSDANVCHWGYHALVLPGGAVTADPFESYNTIDELENEIEKSQEESI